MPKDFQRGYGGPGHWVVDSEMRCRSIMKFLPELPETGSFWRGQIHVNNDAELAQEGEVHHRINSHTSMIWFRGFCRLKNFASQNIHMILSTTLTCLLIPRDRRPSLIMYNAWRFEIGSSVRSYSLAKAHLKGDIE